MIIVRLRFGGFVAFSLDGEQMEENRTIGRKFWDDAAEFSDVVTIDGAEITKSKFLEKNTIGHEQAFDGMFGAP